MIISAYLAIYSPESPYLKVTRVEEYGDRVLPVLKEAYSSASLARALVEGGNYHSVAQTPETCVKGEIALPLEMIKFDDLQEKVRADNAPVEYAYIFDLRDNAWTYVCANYAYVSDQEDEWIQVIS
jgi:hypothetical protein